MKTRSAPARLGLLALLALATDKSWAAYDCFVSVTSSDAFYSSAKSVDTHGTVTLTCSRATADASSLSYRIMADPGLNASGQDRRVKHSVAPSYLSYSLSRGTTEGGGATCANNSNWEAATQGAGKAITGTLNFGVALTASTTWGYCIRLPAQGLPTAGTYTDTVSVSAQYPDSNAGAATAPALLGYTVWVGDHCVFSTYPGTMAFTYTSFSPSAVTATQAFVLRCSQDTPWTVSVDPAASSLLGLDYSISASPVSGTGLGSTGQTVTLTGTIPAGRAGTCSLGTCSGAQTHTVTVSY